MSFSSQKESKQTVVREMEPGAEQLYSKRMPVNEFDTRLLLSTTESLIETLEKLPAEGAAALRILDDEGCDILLQEANNLKYRECSPVVGTGDRAVTQDFDIALNFTDSTRLDEFAAAFERQFNAALEAMSPQPYPTPVHFNDRAMLRYPQGSTGISPHQDLKRFEAVVAILTLEGTGDFYICEDRQKTNSQLIRAERGIMILMRGTHYAGIEHRPFHYVENLSKGRVGFGLRYDVKLAQESTYSYEVPVNS